MKFRQKKNATFRAAMPKHAPVKMQAPLCSATALLLLLLAGLYSTNADLPTAQDPYTATGVRNPPAAPTSRACHRRAFCFVRPRPGSASTRRSAANRVLWTTRRSGRRSSTSHAPPRPRSTCAAASTRSCVPHRAPGPTQLDFRRRLLRERERLLVLMQKEEAEQAEATHRRRRMQESPSGPVVEHTLALLKPDFVKKGDMAVARMLSRVRYEGFQVIRQKKIEPLLRPELAHALYKEHENRSFFPKLMDYVTSGPSFAIELQAVGAVQKWRDLIGPTDPVQAKKEAPDSLRARHGKDVTYNGFHGSESVEAAHREMRLVFEN